MLLSIPLWELSAYKPPLYLGCLFFSIQAQDLTYGQLLDTIIPIAFSFQAAYISSSTASLFILLKESHF